MKCSAYGFRIALMPPASGPSRIKAVAAPSVSPNPANVRILDATLSGFSSLAEHVVEGRASVAKCGADRTGLRPSAFVNISLGQICG